MIYYTHRFLTIALLQSFLVLALDLTTPSTLSASEKEPPTSSTPLVNHGLSLTNPAQFSAGAEEGVVVEPKLKGLKRYALSLSGGGARGYISLSLLSEIEKATKRNICDLFDLIGGTSIGGIWATLLTAPSLRRDTNGKLQPLFTATDLKNRYTEIVATVFQRKSFNPWGIMGPIYKKAGLASFSDQNLGTVTFDQHLARALVTSYDLTANKPKFFKSWREEHSCFYSKDVALATSAAPTFFPLHSLKPAFGPLKETTYRLVDGGVAANDPSICLAVELKKIFGKDCDLTVTSFGTGYCNAPQPFNVLQNGGVLRWASIIPDVLIRGSVETTSYAMEREYGTCYQSWNPEIAAEHNFTDSYRADDLEHFDSAIASMMTTRKSEFDALIKDLLAAAAARDELKENYTPPPPQPQSVASSRKRPREEV